MRKAWLLLLLSLLCSVTALSETRIAALKGPTAMGMVQMMRNADADDSNEEDYSFLIAGAIDEISPMIIQGKVDIAALPANLASVLYNKTNGGVKVLAINTLGVLYLVENGNTVRSIEDLRGRTVYASGKGATPEYALNYILRENGIDPERDVTIEWKSEHAECLSALLAQKDAVAMLPQPFVTTAMMKNDGIRIAIDLNSAWDEIQADIEAPSSLITGVVVACSSFVDEDPDAVDRFLTDYAASVAYVNSNTAEAAELIGSFEIVPAGVALKALPACNIVFIEGNEMRQKLSGYLAVLESQNPVSIGGDLPKDDFYYSR